LKTEQKPSPKPTNKTKVSKRLLLIIGSVSLAIFIIICTVLLIKNHNSKAQLVNQALPDSSVSTTTETPSKTEPTTQASTAPSTQVTTQTTTQKPTETNATIKRTSFNAVYDYQRLYPDMYVDRSANFQKDEPKTVYLTFDDGPSQHTAKVLDILKEENIKATFFVVYKDTEDAKNLFKRIIAEGHQLGIHNTVHDYQMLYKSPASYVEDFHKMDELLYNVTGVHPTIFRFPGGSVNSYNKSTHKAIIDEMIRRGYLFYDWNVSAGDSSSEATGETSYGNVMAKVLSSNPSIVLMHDTKKSTPDSLQRIIKDLKEKGAIMKKLDNSVYPITLGYDGLNH
jgi:peptidoglycan/xylan/chitin deacetylase (PgdA/CDA1 family)